MNKLYRKLFLPTISAVWALPLSLWAGAAPEITVDASHPLGPVKKYLFGHNIEAGDPRGIFTDTFNAKTFDTQYIRTGHGFWNPDAQKINQQVVAEAKQIHLTMLRYPGGCIVANYDWRKAVGPLAQRGDWRFGLNEYIELCRALNAEPIITCSDYILPTEEMPQHLADLVEYLNSPATLEHPWALKRKEWGHAEPFGVKYFELGNESEAGNYYCQPQRKFMEETYGQYAQKSIAAMKKIDPSIKIGVQYKIGEKAYHAADFVITHLYGAKIDGQNVELNFKSAMAHIEHYERKLSDINQSVRKISGHSLPLALTEYNIYYFQQKPVPYRLSAMGGLFCADLIRMLVKSDSSVEIANFWHLANGWFGVVRTKNGEIVKRYAPLAFFQLWGQHFDGRLLSTEVKNSPRFEAPSAEDTPVARGEHFIAEKRVADVTPSTYNFNELQAQGIDAGSILPKTLFFKLNGLKKTCYINFGYLPNHCKNSELQYTLSFESRFIPAGQAVPGGGLGLSLLDARGWEKTSSAVAISNLENDRNWNFHHINFQQRKDCSGILLLFRAPNVTHPLFGTLEVRNLKIETISPAVSPAYHGLTTAASLSDDGKTLHLIVFNKSYDKEIPATVKVNGFIAETAQSWTSGEQPDTTDYRPPVKANILLPQTGQPLQLNFPAHSMTAIDFVRQ